MLKSMDRSTDSNLVNKKLDKQVKDLKSKVMLAENTVLKKN
jgi:hypothetical protein